jgi:hypothetical protein
MVISYKEKALLLRKINAINVDLRRELSSKNKALITRRYNKHSGILENLQDFSQKIVNNKTAKQLSAIKYSVKLKNGKTKVLIYAPDQKVKIRDGKIYKISGDYHETIYPAGKDIFKSATKLFKKKLSRHEYVMISIGGARPFNRVFYDINSLLFYVSNWNPNDEDADKSDLIQHMSLVRIFDGGHDKSTPRIKSGAKTNATRKKGKIRSRRN